MHYDWLDEYLRAKPGVVKDYKLEWGWHRYLVGGKMFAAVMQVSEKYQRPYGGHELVNLKCDVRMAQGYRETYPEVTPGFYMDKANWNAVMLDGALPEDVLRDMCDMSYRLIFEKLTKKLQREIECAKKYPCPCCGFLTFPAPQEDAIAYICPVCYWENDVFDPAADAPSDENRGMTLEEARENFKKLGAVREELVPHVRKPLPGECPVDQ